MEDLLMFYGLLQLVACIFLSLNIVEILNDLNDGLTLYHLIIGILLLPAVIASIFIVLLTLGISIILDWLSKLKEIKIKFK